MFAVVMSNEKFMSHCTLSLQSYSGIGNSTHKHTHTYIHKNDDDLSLRYWLLGVPLSDAENVDEYDKLLFSEESIPLFPFLQLIL